MVSLVIVSHSRELAFAAAELAKKVSSCASLPITAAGGTGIDHKELGTDATDIMAAIKTVHSKDGTLILVDLGSAVLSAKMALELLDPEISSQCKLCPAPLVEGAISAAVQISAGSQLQEVYDEAVSALTPKQSDLGYPTEKSFKSPSIDVPYKSTVFISHLKNGLHARPASALVKALSPYDADVTLYNVTRKRGPQPAGSINRLAVLGILLGDKVEARITGPDAEHAIDALNKLVAENFGEPYTEIVQEKIETEEPHNGLLMLSSGVASGKLHIEDALLNTDPKPLEDIEKEIQSFNIAIAEVKRSILSNKKDMIEQGHINEAEIFEAHLLILEDEDILEQVKKEIESKQQSAAYLYRLKMQEIADEFRSLPGSYMPQRANDVLDVASQVIKVLSGDNLNHLQNDEDIILYAKEITPSMIAKYNKGCLKGMISQQGGLSSHVAILAKTLGIPTIAGYTLPGDMLKGSVVIMDAQKLEININPSEDKVLEFNNLLKQWEEKKKQDFLYSQKAPIMKDDTVVTVLANVGDALTAKLAAQHGAKGIGLLRTEFMFLSSPMQPNENEQVRILEDIFRHFPEDNITVRTLDIGGDKPLSWLKQSKEDNPFLGVRGIRLCQREKELFLIHMKAILRAGYNYNIKIMIPMISTVEELEFSRATLEKAHHELVIEGVSHKWPVKLGIMIETPAAVLMAEELAQNADFFSIGSNDLTQYCMAAERGNKSLAELADFLQPSVLRMIKSVADCAAKHSIGISVCGEMAGHPHGANLLIGMGIRELSMNPSSVGTVKRMIINSTVKDTEKLTSQALKQSTIKDVKKLFSY